MNKKGGTVTFDAEEYLKLLDEMAALEKRLRELGKEGYKVDGVTTRPPRPASREKKDKIEAMVLDDINISEIEWKLSNRQGGGLATDDSSWCWAFPYTKDGGIRRETAQLVMALERYGRVQVGPYLIELSGRDKTLLSRTKVR